MAMPVWVAGPVMAPSPSSLAMPKSRIFALRAPSSSRSTMMFSGFRSRCTISPPWAAASPLPTQSRICSASSSCSTSRSRMNWRRGGPSRNSITK